MDSRHHRFDFIELPVTDMERAKAFYGKAFGWTFVDYGPDYADIQGAGVSGGLRAVATPPVRGGALVILYSGDLAASEAAVVSAGATITERHDFPGGRRFQFLDPAGNELGIWTEVK